VSERREPVVIEPGEPGAWGSSGQGGSAGGGSPRVEYRGWYWSWDGGRERLPWLGIFLVALGGALLVGQFTTPLSASTLLFDALAAAFLVTWLVNGARGAMLPALFFLGLGLAGTLSDAGAISGSGWGTLFVGIALLAAWLIGRWWGGRHGWALWVGLLFVVVGAIQVAGQIPGFPDLGQLWPLLIVALGVWIIWRAYQRPRRV